MEFTLAFALDFKVVIFVGVNTGFKIDKAIYILKVMTVNSDEGAVCFCTIFPAQRRVRIFAATSSWTELMLGSRNVRTSRTFINYIYIASCLHHDHRPLTAALLINRRYS